MEVQEFVKVEIREKSLVSIHLEQNSLSQHALTYQIVSLGDLTLLSGTANEEGCFGMHCVSNYPPSQVCSTSPFSNSLRSSTSSGSRRKA